MSSADTFFVVIVTALCFGMYGRSAGMNDAEERIAEACRQHSEFAIDADHRFTCVPAQGGAQ